MNMEAVYALVFLGLVFLHFYVLFASRRWEKAFKYWKLWEFLVAIPVLPAIGIGYLVVLAATFVRKIKVTHKVKQFFNRPMHTFWKKPKRIKGD